MVNAKDILTINHYDFLKAVINNPHYKYPAPCYSEDGSVCYFKDLEDMGLIVSTGSYKWEITDKVKVNILIDLK